MPNGDLQEPESDGSQDGSQVSQHESSIEASLESIVEATADARDIAEQIAQLQEKLSEERDARKEERVLWGLLTLIFFNVAIFMAMPSVMGPLVIGFFELIALILFARRMGVEEIVQILQGLFEKVARTRD